MTALLDRLEELEARERAAYAAMCDDSPPEGAAIKWAKANGALNKALDLPLLIAEIRRLKGALEDAFSEVNGAYGYAGAEEPFPIAKAGKAASVMYHALAAHERAMEAGA